MAKTVRHYTHDIVGLTNEEYEAIRTGLDLYIEQLTRPTSIVNETVADEHKKFLHKIQSLRDDLRG